MYAEIYPAPLGAPFQTSDREKLHCLPTDEGRPWFILSQATLYSLAVTALQLSTTYFCLSFLLAGYAWSLLVAQEEHASLLTSREGDRCIALRHFLKLRKRQEPTTC